MQKIIAKPIQKYQQKTSSKAFFNSWRMPKTKQTKVLGGLYWGGTSKSRGYGSSSVFLRRKGKFNLLGTTTSFDKAFLMGQRKAERSLAASFKVIGTPSKSFRTPVGFYSKREKGAILFIEKRSKRLNTGSELSEIFGSKRKGKKSRGFSF